MTRLEVVAAQHPSERIRKRSARMPAKVLHYFDDFERVIEVLVDPDEPENGKVAHTVAFTRMYERGSYVEFERVPGVFERIYTPGKPFIGVTCYESQSLANCQANKHGMHCSHVESAIKELLTHAHKGVLNE